MPRIAVKIEVSEEEKVQLQKRVNQRVMRKQLAERAQIVLDYATARENRDIANDRNIGGQTVAKQSMDSRNQNLR